MSIDSDIRTTLRRTAEAAEAPVIDEAGFGRRVRRHRRKRRAGLAGAAAAVAAIALAVPVAVNHFASDGSAQSPAASGSTESDRSPTYFLVGQRATILDPSGVTHDVGVWADGIVAQTADGVILSGPQGLVRLRATRAGDEWSFERVPLPVQDVQSAALSTGATHLAVIDPDETLVVYDLESGDVTKSIPNDRSATVLGFSDALLSRRVLWTVDDTLTLGTGDNAVEIPLHGASPMDATVGADVVAVGGWSTTRLYEVAGGEPTEIGEVAGMGDLSPDGRYYLAAPEQAPATIWERDSDRSRPLRGLDGAAEQVRWLDYDTALVATGTLRHGEQVKLLFACEASTLRCHEVFDAGTSRVWIGR